MDLVLDREYYPGGTNGTLSLDGKILCKCIEPPTAFFKSDLACLSEGNYELDLLPDNQMQRIILFKCPNGIRSANPERLELCTKQVQQNIVPVSEITGEGRGVPSSKALDYLTHLIEQALQKGEKATLEIRSCPEQALNLTCHQIEWME